LTQKWPITWGGGGVVPESANASIEWDVRGDDKFMSLQSNYAVGQASWEIPTLVKRDGIGRETTICRDSIVIYQRVDGGISVHDPLQPFGSADVPLPNWAVLHDCKPQYERIRDPHGTRVLQFRDLDVWNGLSLSSGGPLVCEGLVRDVASWARQHNNECFEQLAKVFEILAEREGYRLTRDVKRVSVSDRRDCPILDSLTGPLPVMHAPAGLRRILALAYIVVWALHEHRTTAGMLNVPPVQSFVLLIDEVESHLHPRWQRTILPSLLKAFGHDTPLQVVATTHSPMVLASLEPHFDSECDAWFDLDLAEQKAVLTQREYISRGEIGNWLASNAFDLKEPRSQEGEQAVVAAIALMNAGSQDIPAVLAVEEKLRAARLPDVDCFWVQWWHFRKRVLAESLENSRETPEPRST
jgi:hypothetical protein